MNGKLAQQVASSGDQALIYVVIAVGGALILVLASLLWYFIRARMLAKDRRDELLEKRLSSGAEAMQRVGQEVTSLQKQLNDYRKEYYETVSKLLEKSEFREYKRDHEKVHATLEALVTQMGNSLGQITGNLENQSDLMKELRQDVKSVLQSHH